jgi:hypothetical protein
MRMSHCHSNGYGFDDDRWVTHTVESSYRIMLRSFTRWTVLDRVTSEELGWIHKYFAGIELLEEPMYSGAACFRLCFRAEVGSEANRSGGCHLLVTRENSAR